MLKCIKNEGTTQVKTILESYDFPQEREGTDHRIYHGVHAFQAIQKDIGHYWKVVK